MGHEHAGISMSVQVAKSGEVWCEGARLRMNPLSPHFNLVEARRCLDFAIQVRLALLFFGAALTAVSLSFFISLVFSRKCFFPSSSYVK